MSKCKFLLSALLAAPLALFGTTAHAVPIQVALGVVIDGSGSISGTNFATQRTAYAAVLGDAAVLPADGSVVINVVQFATGTQIEQTAIRINSEADRTTLLNSINAMTQLGGATNIGGGIDTSRIDMDAFLAGLLPTDFDASFRKLIDVSTDGQHNTGTNPTTATNSALGAGYSQVNCLGIGAGADCTWNLGGLDFVATTFAGVEAALRQKISIEIQGVPEPATALLLSAGLLGFGWVRRRATA